MDRLHVLLNGIEKRLQPFLLRLASLPATYVILSGPSFAIHVIGLSLVHSDSKDETDYSLGWMDDCEGRGETSGRLS